MKGHESKDAILAERQDEIMDVTIEVFGAHDYKIASTEEIARRAGKLDAVLLSAGMAVIRPKSLGRRRTFYENN